jgi:hypothetical protein
MNPLLKLFDDCGSFIRATPPAKKTASLIKKEIIGAQFRNRSLLGCAFGNTTAKM